MPGRAQPHRWRRPDRAHALALAALALFVALTAANAGDSAGWTAFDNLSEAAAAVLATVLCVRRMRRERVAYASICELRRQEDALADADAVDLQRHARAAWSLLSAAVAAWALGQIGWTVYETGFGIQPSGVTPLDGFFLSSSVLLICGLLAMVRTPAGYLSQLRGAAEALFIACGCLLFSWSLVIGPLFAQSRASTLGGIVNIAYPVLDAVAIASAVFVALRRRHDPPAGLGLLAFGAVGLAISDSALWYLTTAEASLPGVNPLDAGWAAGFLLIALAARGEGRRAPVRERSRQGMFEQALPALPVGLGVATILVEWVLKGSVPSPGALLVLGALVLMSSVVLLSVVSLENHVLTGDLERRVAERTAALHGRERYYRALVQNSSDVVLVVDPLLRISYASDSVRSIFGFEPGELAGQSLRVFGKAAVSALTEAIGRVESSPGKAARVEWPLRDSAGRARSAESMVTNLYAEEPVSGYVLNTRDVTDRASLADQLRRQALHDPLTDLPNRVLLSDRAGLATARSARTGEQIAVMVVDLDGFKLINDAVGHEAGDEVLRTVAELLRGAVGPDDTVARLGGDEFAILMAPAAHALALAERIRATLDAELPVAGASRSISASVGVAVGTGAGTTFNQLLSNADVALHVAKGAGKNSVQLFQTSMSQQARRRFKLQADLQTAVDRQEFWLLYEPQFDASEGHLVGFEARLRWNHPELGLLAPERFMALAEETGLIVPMGAWLLTEALTQTSAWNRTDARARPLSIAVKVSAVQLNAPSIVGNVRAALASSGIGPRHVVLEVRESALVDCSPRVIDVLHALKAIGVRLAIDEFGTGHASVSYLQGMPIDIVKIDKGLVSASGREGRQRDLFEAIVKMGHVLSLTTVADGIEHPSELEAVAQAGCDIAQGRLLGRPLPPETAHHLIVEQATALATVAA